MTDQLTKGGLQPGSIKNLITEEEVFFMFNPESFKITKTNSWQGATKDAVMEGNTVKQMAVNVPRIYFQSGNAATLSLTLHFDTLGQTPKTDVRVFTLPLYKMMLIDASTINAQTNKGTPPPVAFSWGRFYFKAVITSLDQNFTLFDENGMPLRCVATVSMTQYHDETEQEEQVAGLAPGATLDGTMTFTGGERFDVLIAKASAAGGAAAPKSPKDWRTWAASNKVDNPLAIRSGTQLNK